MTRAEILEARRQLTSLRLKYQKEVMQAYDKEYYAELRKLQEECGKIGHSKGYYYDNGIGTAWYRCPTCDARHSIETYGESAA